MGANPVPETQCYISYFDFNTSEDANSLKVHHFIIVFLCAMNRRDKI
jgi:hypothetical protein